MNKASPVDLRKSAELANILIKSGIEFVPVIVVNQEQKNRLIDDLLKSLDMALSEANHLDRSEEDEGKD